MESSRRSARPADPAVSGEIARAVLSAVAASRDATAHEDGPVLVAFSGGLDSTVLLHASVSALGAARCLAVHVHHGLQPAADDWPAHCAEQAARLGVSFEVLRLHRMSDASGGSEAWAREARYAALAEASRRLGARAVLTGHHADDQAETLLMRIARGTGLDGLRGIRAQTAFGGVRILRPLLQLPRAVLANYAQAHHLQWVEDPTNADTAHLRNALRRGVLPALDAAAPGFRQNLLRVSAFIDEARDAVDALAGIDLAVALESSDDVPLGVPAGALRAETLSGLSDARRRAALRLWIARLGLPMPDEARLREVDRQLLSPGAGRGMVQHAGRRLLRDRGWLFDAPVLPASVLPAPFTLCWQGEDALDLPAYGGTLRFEPTSAEHGVSAAWLRASPLSVVPPRSSARIRLAANGRQRTLKNLHQEAGVPAIARRSLPLVYVDDALLFAAGIGMDQDPRWPREGPRVSLRWSAASV